MGKRVKLGTLNDFPEGAIVGREVEGRDLIVVNLGGEINVLEGICSHEYARLESGFLVGDRVMCPLHLSQFDIHTGQATSPPAEEPLAKYPVEVEGKEVYTEVN